jgi:hypothetical protein
MQNKLNLDMEQLLDFIIQNRQTVNTNETAGMDASTQLIQFQQSSSGEMTSPAGGAEGENQSSNNGDEENEDETLRVVEIQQIASTSTHLASSSSQAQLPNNISPNICKEVANDEKSQKMERKMARSSNERQEEEEEKEATTTTTTIVPLAASPESSDTIL